MIKSPTFPTRSTVFVSVAIAISLPAAITSGYPVIVRGGDDRTFVPASPDAPPTADPVRYDAIVVVGGHSAALDAHGICRITL